MNPKAPYVLGLAIEKALTSKIAVLSCPKAYHWATDTHTFSVMRDTDLSPKDVLARAIAHLATPKNKRG